MAEPGRPQRASQGIAGTWPIGRTASAGGFAPAGFGAWPAIIGTLREWASAEAGAGRLLPWVPVAFGAGIAVYFAADHEPVLWVVAATAVALMLGAVLLRRSRLFAPAIMIAAVAAGFAMATWKTARIAHTVLAKPLYSVSLSGFVETRDIRERTDRFVLRVTAMEAQRSDVKLERVRLSVRKGTAPEVGSFVQLKARLMPPLSPVRPGSYDFSRDIFFQGIGASGFVMGAIAASVPPDGGGLRLRYAATMQGLRDAIDARIRATLEGDNRAIATALLTGRRDAITTPVNDAMFISGLGHVLSISGYHMAVVAGVVFFAVRAMLALIPGLATGFPIKKWSAAAALVAAAFYLLLSGAEVATQRSFFMTAVVLIAVMVDRRAITFRTLAVAALIVLAVAPEALVHPSFQMSFAATLGLVALVQVGMPNLFASPDHSATARIALWGGREIAMLFLASLIAGLATTRLPLPPRDALWRARQPWRDAGGFGAGDAGWAARTARSAIRARWRLLVGDGDRYRLDGRGLALGGGAAGCGRPHPGLRHRAADRGQPRNHRDGLVTHALAVVRCAGAAGRDPLGAVGAAARYSDRRGWRERRGAGQGWAPPHDPGEQGRLSAQGVARGRRRSSRHWQRLACRRRIVRRVRLCDIACRRAAGRAGATR